MFRTLIEENYFLLLVVVGVAVLNVNNLFCHRGGGFHDFVMMIGFHVDHLSWCLVMVVVVVVPRM